MNLPPPDESAEPSTALRSRSALLRRLADVVCLPSSRVNMLERAMTADLLVDVLRDAGPVDLAVGTSKTFRMLARLTGAAPSSAGPRVRRVLTQAGLRQLTSFISRMTAADRAELEGVSADRSHQIVAGALVAEAAMRHLGIEQLQMCPWALREGVILRRADAGEGVSGSFRIDD